MALKLYRLRFHSSFHSGEREGFLESVEPIIHSDTIFSAFCHCFKLLYGKDALEKTLIEFANKKPLFLLSSAFPYIGETLYFPVPLNQIPKEKQLKKILFVEKKAFEELISGKTIEQVLLSNYIYISSENKPWEIQITPRISLNRLTNSPGENFFHFGEIFFSNQDTGLFFIVDFFDNDFIEKFQATLNLMSDEGIGGDRTIGKGLFDVQYSDISFNIPENIDGFITISLLHPMNNEIPRINDGYYQVIERKGYIFSHTGRNLRKKSVRMIAEGSVFSSQIIGDIVDLTPEIFSGHKIYRYGLCFSLPCKLKVENEN